MKRPNILFVFADDWGRYASAYAPLEGEHSINHLLHTPHFDRVAREGVLFANAVVPAPSCTPCRSSVLTGRYFWQTGRGAILQGAVWDESIPSYPLILEQQGYHIGYTYKVWGPGEPAHAPYGGERTRYQSAGGRFGGFSSHATKRAKDCGVTDAKRELLDEVRGNFDEFLEARPDDTPFCYWWGPTNTHRQWERGSGKALWGLDPDQLKGRLPAFLPDVPEIREDVADYLGECLAVDAGLGVLLQRLEELGELDNTLVVVSGDHGIPGFPRGKCNLYDIGSEVALAARWPGRIPGGRVVDDAVNLMDLSPTFLDAAGAPHPEGEAGASLMDVLTSGASGQVDAERTFVVTGRERHVAAARDGNLPYPQRAIRTKDYLYIRNYEPTRWPMGDPMGLDDPETEPPAMDALLYDTCVAYADMDGSPTKAWMIVNRADASVAPLFDIGFGKRPGEELFDLRKDPDHMQDLADREDLAGIKSALASLLDGVLREQQDPRVVDDACCFEHPPFTDPWV